MPKVRHCVIRVDGQTSESLYDDLIALEVRERVGEPATFALQVAIFKRANGGWTRLDEQSFADGGFCPWQRVTILVGYDATPDVLVDGYVAGVAPRFEPVEADSHVLVWGYDATYAMDITEQVKPWENKKYSDIALEVFQSYGLKASIPETISDTQLIQDKDRELLIQRGTDWRFLKKLGQRVGFDVFVRGGVGYFRPPELTRTDQKDLAVHMGTRLTNVIRFEPRVVADKPESVAMQRPNALTKRIEKVLVSASPQRSLGARQSAALLQGRSMGQRPATLGRPVPCISEQALEAFATGLRREHDWNVTGEGELDGVLYGRALRADGTVLIKGAGETFSGRYYVTDVTHRITPEAYTQSFKVARNGLDVLGDEAFQSVNADPTELAGNDERVAVSDQGLTVAP